MHAGHWVGVAAVLYEGLVGAAEVAYGTGASSNSTLTSIQNLPSVGSLVTGTTTNAMTGGIVDLAIAAGIYFFVLHDHLFG